MSKINYGSSHKIQQVIKEFTQKCEETKESKRIEIRLQSICDYIKNLLPTTNSFPNLSDLTCDSFDFNKKIGKIDDYVQCLGDISRKLERRKKRFEDIVLEVDTKENKTGGSGGHTSLSDHSKNFTRKSTEFLVYYQYIVNIKETVIKYTQHIHEIKTLVVTEIQNLVNQINSFKVQLEVVKKELQRLQDHQSIRGYNKLLQGYVSGFGLLDKIRGYANNLKCVENLSSENNEQIVKRLKRFDSRAYYYCINLIRNTVKSFLRTLESEHSSEISRDNPHLQTAMSTLESVKNKLCSLEASGKIVDHLIKITPIITQLVPFLDKVDSVISRMQKERDYPTDQLKTTSQQLEIMKRFRDGMEKEIEKMGECIEAIKEITEASKTIPKHYQEYIQSLTKFKEALEQLETCLDYLVVRFLSCSLCSTVSKLVRLIDTSKSDCHETMHFQCSIGTTILSHTLFKLEAQLYDYFWLLFRHFCVIDLKVHISMLYECITMFDTIFCIIKKVNDCGCVLRFTTPNTNEGYTFAFYFVRPKTIIDKGKKRKYEMDIKCNSHCLCVLINYGFYPNLVMCLCYLVDMELEVSNIISRHMNRYTEFESYRTSVCKLLIMAIKVFYKLALWLRTQYLTKHDKDNNCSSTNSEGTCKCKCFCKQSQHKYNQWFMSVILWLDYLLKNLSELDICMIEHYCQLLSNLYSWLNWMDFCNYTNSSTQNSDRPAPSTQLPAIPPTLKVKCCLICLNVKVMGISAHLLCSVIDTFYKSNKKLENCKCQELDCSFSCSEDVSKLCSKCEPFENLKKIGDNLTDGKECELFKDLKEKMSSTKVTEKLLNLCTCKDKPPDTCKEVSYKFFDVCSHLIEFSKDFETDELKCGCESVEQCCCCCKCDECGNGKQRDCREKGNGNGHANGGHNGGGSGATSGSQGSGQGTTEQGKCPCQDGKKNGSEQCCCIKQSTDGKRKCCNCKEGKPPAKKTECECCCLSCCALEKDKEKEAQKKEGEKKEEGTNNCPCKKKKKKDKPKKHCKDDDNLKDKRCCCKCCPDKNGGETKGNGTSSTTPNSSSSAPPTTNPEKECCCCCKCKTNCKNGGTTTTTTGGGGSSNSKCSCHSSNQQVHNGQHSGHKDCNCKCYCCFECNHEKSALKSICKQFAYELKSSISVLSKLASNLSIECCQIYS